MVELKINLFERGKQRFIAELVQDDTIMGEGPTPYAALADLIDEIRTHEYFRGDSE